MNMHHGVSSIASVKGETMEQAGGTGFRDMIRIAFRSRRGCGQSPVIVSISVGCPKVTINTHMRSPALIDSKVGQSAEWTTRRSMKMIVKAH
jgi:hypothetical protein